MSSCCDFGIAILIHTINRITVGEIGQICRWQKGGREVKKLLKFLPYFDISCDVQPLSRSILKFNVTLKSVFNWNSRWHGGKQLCFLLGIAYKN